MKWKRLGKDILIGICGLLFLFVLAFLNTFDEGEMILGILFVVIILIGCGVILYLSGVFEIIKERYW